MPAHPFAAALVVVAVMTALDDTHGARADASAGGAPTTPPARVEMARPAAAPAPAPATAEDVLSVVNAAKGRVVLVNAWATWCIPCRQEMPDLLRLRKELQGSGFDLVLVTTDFQKSVGEATKFLTSQGVDFPTWIKTQRDPEFIDGLDPSWSGALPFTVLFDRTGRRVASWEGRESLEQMRARILPLIEARGDTP